jgi:hypothetical protein
LQPLKLDGVTVKRKQSKGKGGNPVLAYARIYRQGDETGDSLVQSSKLLEDSEGKLLQKQDGIFWSERQEEESEQGTISIEIDEGKLENTLLEVGIQSGNRKEILVSMMLDLGKISKKKSLVMLKLQIPNRDKKKFFARKKQTKFQMDAVECVVKNELVLHSACRIREEIDASYSIAATAQDTSTNLNRTEPTKEMPYIDQALLAGSAVVDAIAVHTTKFLNVTNSRDSGKEDQELPREVYQNDTEIAEETVHTGRTPLFTFESDNTDSDFVTESGEEEEEDDDDDDEEGEDEESKEEEEAEGEAEAEESSEKHIDDKKLWSFDMNAYGMEMKLPVENGKSFMSHIKRKLSKSKDSAHESKPEPKPIEERDSFSVEYIPPARSTKPKKKKPSKKKKHGKKNLSTKRNAGMKRKPTKSKVEDRSRFVQELVESDSDTYSGRSGSTRLSRFNPSYICWLIPNDFRDLMLAATGSGGSVSSKSVTSSVSVHSDHDVDTTELVEENDEIPEKANDEIVQRAIEPTTNEDDKNELVAQLVKQLLNDTDGDSVATDDLISIAAELNMTPSDLINAIEAIGNEIEE